MVLTCNKQNKQTKNQIFLFSSFNHITVGKIDAIANFWHGYFCVPFLLAGMHFSTDGLWRIVRHQLFDELVHILLNKLLARIVKNLYDITALVQLGFDFILREMMDLVSCCEMYGQFNNFVLNMTPTTLGLGERIFFTAAVMSLHTVHFILKLSSMPSASTTLSYEANMNHITIKQI